MPTYAGIINIITPGGAAGGPNVKSYRVGGNDTNGVTVKALANPQLTPELGTEATLMGYKGGEPTNQETPTYNGGEEEVVPVPASGGRRKSAKNRTRGGKRRARRTRGGKRC